MKSSPSCTSLSFPSTSSSSSSTLPIINHKTHLLEKPKSTTKTKRVKKNANPEINATNIAKNPTPLKRSSIYRGVTRHRWTGRFEAHLWDKFSWNNIQNKKGKQVYLGAYDNEEAAARTYDLAALKYWGPASSLNFPIETHKKEFEEMQKLTKEEYLATLRRQSSGFSRGVSKFRGVARHHHNGRWEARIGRVLGNKYLYLGTYGTQEEAAAAYDMAAIQYRGVSAVTNFDISNYSDFVKQCSLSRTDETQPPNPDCKTEPEQQQQQQQQVEPEKHEMEMLIPEQPLVPSYDNPSPSATMQEMMYDNSPSSTTMQEMMMDPISNDQDFLNWDFDNTEFFDDPLLVPDVPLEPALLGDVPDLLFDENFEDLLFVDQTDLSWLDD